MDAEFSGLSFWYCFSWFRLTSKSFVKKKKKREKKEKEKRKEEEKISQVMMMIYERNQSKKRTLAVMSLEEVMK